MVEQILNQFIQGPKLDIPTWTMGSGPERYFIVAGLHGDEPTSIHVAMKLIDYLSNQEINGTIEIMPLANKQAFLSRSRTSLDNKDLNRNFPGNEKGTITEKLANKIWKKAKEADYVLDLHCCGEDSSPYILATHKEHKHSKEFAKSLGVEVCIQSSGIDKPQLFVEASKIGIPSAIIEIPGGGDRGWKPSNYVDQIFNAVRLSLYRLDFLDDNPRIDVEPRFARELSTLTSSTNGIFTPVAELGEDLSSMDPVGRINDEVDITLPEAGRLVFSSPDKFILQGEVVARYVIYQP